MSTRLVILISGRGSNMLAIARACQDGTLDATVVKVLANRADAPGLEHAASLGIDTAVVEHRDFPIREHFDRALHEQILQARPDWVVMAGFMRIMGPEFICHWQGRMVNIHPSLLPRYPGLDTHARALANGDTTAGASVHFVTTELDGGPVIAQAEVAIRSDDTAESLAARVLAEEHGLYVRAMQNCIAGVARFESDMGSDAGTVSRPVPATSSTEFTTG